MKWIASLILVISMTWGAIAQPLTFDNFSQRDNNNIDSELVLAVDASGSIEPNELALQRVAYAKAVISDEFIRQAVKGKHKSIAIYYFEFHEEPVRFVDWHIIHDMESARTFANKIVALPHGEGKSTSISTALVHARDQLDNNPYRSNKRIIDLSADGVNNWGPMPMKQAKEYALAGGKTTINGLAVIVSVNEAVKGVVDFLKNQVIGGPGHFMYAVKNINEMSERIKLKLLDEIA